MQPIKKIYFSCFTLLRVTRALWKYFPMVTPPPPDSYWKIRQIDPPIPPGKSDPFRGDGDGGGGGNGYFLEPHILNLEASLH